MQLLKNPCTALLWSLPEIKKSIITNLEETICFSKESHEL